MVYKSFHKKSSGGVGTCAQSEILAKKNKHTIKSENTPNQQLSEGELYKPIMRKFEKTLKNINFLKTIFGVLILQNAINK